ncbi:MAG: chromosome segregation protein SMC [Clostridia bacterium]|nr:chromosome segregation protein SMC [Clostridia bacterium]
MNFKGLDLAGFKSFADKIEIKFDDGVTAIVGPNGCGKSNIADAVRWVLGEQSSKTLRGSSMQDIIFNGTEKRKSLSYCEVTMTFDNLDRFFKYEFDKIAITRKLYRSGESEYLLNRVPCRLKDITNLLYDSGLGRDGYSIIGQDQVGRILSSKPEDRRSIFEDAAGISKYKSRKIEAERKLERTRDNILKLQLVIDEIDRQLGPMRKQSEDAKSFLELKEALKNLEINAYIYQYENAHDMKSKISGKLAAVNEELELRQTELTEVSEEYSNNMSSIDAIDKTVERLHESILNLTVSLEKQVGEANVVKERVKFLKDQNNRLNLDLTNYDKLIEMLSARLKDRDESLQVSNKNLGELRKEEEEITQKYLMIVDELNLSEDETESSHKSMFDAMDRLTSIKSNSSRLEAEKEANKTSLEEIKLRKEILNQRIDENNKIKGGILQSLKELEEQNKEQQDTALKSKLFLQDKQDKIAELDSERQNAATRIQVYENRKRMLEDMQAEHEGYAGSVKKLLKESERSIEFAKKMVGVLASLITVPEKFETAIETALGNALQNIVTRNEHDAKELIEYLKREQYGRATFLPITSMRPRNLNPEYRNILNHSGCFGIAKDLISYGSDIENVVSNLLGATIVVDNLETAITFAQSSHFEYKIVTLDGDVINPKGSMSGGSRKSEAVNLISRDREIKTLATEIDKFKDILNNGEAKVKGEKEEYIKLSKQYEFLASKQNELEVEIAKENEKFSNLQTLILSFENEIITLENSEKIINNKINLITNELKSIDELEMSVGANKEGANEAIEKRQNKFAGLKTEREKLNSELTEKRVKIASITSEIIATTQELERLDNQLCEAQEKKCECAQELEKNSATIDEADRIIAVQIENVASAETKRKLEGLKEEQSKLDENKISLQQSLKQLDERRTQLIEEVNKINERKLNEEFKINKVDTDIETMQTKIFEEYNLDYNSCLEFRDMEFEYNKGSTEINRIKREIAKLGYINVAAIEDSKLLGERYDNLANQVDDLNKAQNELIEIINELSTEMTNKFNSEFEKINENFKTTFKELFGGGNAKLELVGSENVLEAGVEIYAEPPGKKLQSNTLLSGGEKALTAIAILFAILKLKPMPFCLLDEIEAALDEANVYRFAQYLRRFSKETQFIVITHKKPTMELADSLYGVTMEEKGVSRVVSVRLSDIKDFDKNENTTV